MSLIWQALMNDARVSSLIGKPNYRLSLRPIQRGLVSLQVA